MRTAARTGRVEMISQASAAPARSRIAAMIRTRRVRAVMGVVSERIDRLFLEPLLEVVAQAFDDRISLGLDEQLLDDGLDALRAPLAALAKVGLGSVADDVGGGRRGAGLGQADCPIAKRCERAGKAAGHDCQAGHR